MVSPRIAPCRPLWIFFVIEKNVSISGPHPPVRLESQVAQQGNLRAQNLSHPAAVRRGVHVQYSRTPQRRRERSQLGDRIGSSTRLVVGKDLLAGRDEVKHALFLIPGWQSGREQAAALG